MKVSDELREFAYLHFSGSENVGPCDALMGIADRIRNLAKKEDRQCQ